MSDLVLQRLDGARKFLMQATTIEKAKQAIAIGEAVKIYAKRVGATVETINQASEYQLWAERNLGVILLATPKHPPGRNGSRMEPISKEPKPKTLKEIGIHKKISSRAQTFARVPEPEFRQALAQPETFELNPRRLLKAFKENQQRESRTQKRKACSAEIHPGIIVGDFRKCADKVSDGALSLIFTDPPYDREASKMLPALADFGASKLAEGGSLLCYVGQTQLPSAIDALRTKLRYWWTIACIHAGGSTVMREYGINAGWKAVLWFVKGTRDNNSVMVSDIMSGGQEKDHHDWQQAESEASYWIEKLCPADGIVCDPFLGGGTTAAAAKSLKRQWIGFEIDPDAAKIASGRIGK